MPSVEFPLANKQLSQFCKTYHIQWLALFGSRAKGTAKKGSDIDLLVEFEPDAAVGLIEFAHIREELGRLLSGYRLDLVSRRGLNRHIREEVLASARVLYEAG